MAKTSKTPNNPKDPLLRHIAMMQLIPRAPAEISTRLLQEKLKARGFEIDVRSLQRDLNRLMEKDFDIDCNTGVRPYRWSFKELSRFNLPQQDTPTALTLHLVESHLRHLLPQGVMRQLAPQFRAAREHLDQLTQNQLARWPKRVRAIPNGQALMPAEVDPQVWAAVSEALVGQRQLRVRYRSRSKGCEHKSLRLHPQSLVSRHAVSYLVAMADDYEDLRHFALHRIEQAEVIDEPRTHARQRNDHDIDAYIASGAFGTPRAGAANGQPVELVADVDAQTAWLLRETPLAAGQELTLLPQSDNGWHRLRVPLPDSQETLWWILGLNSRIRVHEPAHWVEEIKEHLATTLRLYGSGGAGDA